MGPAKRLQQYGVGSGASVIEDNGTIAMGKLDVDLSSIMETRLKSRHSSP